MLPQSVRKALHLLVFLSLDFGGGNFGPQFDDAGQILHGDCRQGLLFQLLDLGGKLAKPAADGSHPFKILVFGILVQHPKLQLIIIPLFAKLCQLGKLFAAQIDIGTGFVQQVDGLIRQEAVGDIPLRQHNTLTGNFGRNGDAVIFGIGFGNALQNLAGFFQGGFRHGNRLKTPLQSSVLFDILSVFGMGGGTDDLNIPPGKRGL